jgi:hypothetical protein
VNRASELCSLMPNRASFCGRTIQPSIILLSPLDGYSHGRITYGSHGRQRRVHGVFQISQVRLMQLATIGEMLILTGPDVDGGVEQH